MTGRFKYDGPGFYQQDNGEKAQVVGIGQGLILGFTSNRDIHAWGLDGSYTGGEYPCHLDLVAKWTEPVEPNLDPSVLKGLQFSDR